MGMFDNIDWSNLMADALGGAVGAAAPPGAATRMAQQQPPPMPAPPPIDTGAVAPSNDQATGTDPYPIRDVPLPRPRPPDLAGALAPTGSDMAWQGPPASAALGPAPDIPATPTRPPPPVAAGPPGVRPPMDPSGMMINARQPGPPYPPTGPFLSSAFGPNPRLTMQQTGSLGAGLASVAQNWNKPGLAAFAGSAGAAIQGGSKADREYFNELATAVRINDAYNTAQTRTNLMKARLDYMQKVGTLGGRNAAWQMSEPGRFDLAERRVTANVESKRKELQEELKSPIQADREAAQKKLDAFAMDERKRVYPGYGLDPSRYDNYQNLGKPAYKDGKIDVEATGKNALRPRTWEEFQATVKPGDYYWTQKNGKPILLQRTSDVPLPADDPRSPIASIPYYPDNMPDEEAA